MNSLLMSIIDHRNARGMTSMREKYLRIGDGHIRLAWDGGVPESFAGHLYAPWRTCEHTPQHTVSIGCVDGVFRIDAPSGELAASDMGSGLAHFEYSVTVLAQQMLSDYLQIHASCFGDGGRSVLAVGGHGSGKTTLALAAITMGMRALTDDICVIGHDNRRALGFPRPFKATDDTWNLRPRPAPDDCPSYFAVPDITYVFFHDPPGKYYCPESKISHVLFPVRGNTATKLVKLGETEALGRLLRQGFNYTRFGEHETVQRLLDLIRIAQPWELRFSDHWDAIGAIRALLDS